jgi:acetyl esterase/lipase
MVAEELVTDVPRDLGNGPSRLEQLRAARRMLIVLSAVLDIPVLGPTMKVFTREPRRESVEIAGTPAEFVTPARKGPSPAWVFVTGAHPLRRAEPIVHKVADGLGRAGYAVVVPDLPGLGEGEITPHTIDATARVVDWTASRPEVADGRIALCGASVGASLALLVAERVELAESISVVASVCPFADLEKLVCLATTRSYGLDGLTGEYDTAILLRRVVARSLLMTLPESVERTDLLDRVGDILLDEQDPIAPLREVDAESLGPDARSMIRLLTNEDPRRFGALYAELPANARRLVESLSPLPAASQVRARVELAVPPLDPYFPPGETRALAAALPGARLTVSGTLDHTRPMMSRAQIGDFSRFCGFVLRSLADA